MCMHLHMCGTSGIYSISYKVRTGVAVGKVLLGGAVVGPEGDGDDGKGRESSKSEGGHAEGASGTPVAGAPPGGWPSWLPEGAASELQLLHALPAELGLKNVAVSLTSPNEQTQDAWRAWLGLSAPESAPPPRYARELPTLTAKLLLVRALRPDRTALAAEAYADAVLRAQLPAAARAADVAVTGGRFADAPAADAGGQALLPPARVRLFDAAADCGADAPVVVFADGADLGALQLLRALAEETCCGRQPPTPAASQQPQLALGGPGDEPPAEPARFVVVAAGEAGARARAERALRDGLGRGDWLVLDGADRAPALAARLAAALAAAFPRGGVARTFRLWLLAHGGGPDDARGPDAGLPPACVRRASVASLRPPPAAREAMGEASELAVGLAAAGVLPPAGWRALHAVATLHVAVRARGGRLFPAVPLPGARELRVALAETLQAVDDLGNVLCKLATVSVNAISPIRASACVRSLCVFVVCVCVCVCVRCVCVNIGNVLCLITCCAKCVWPEWGGEGG
ncbi:hypothetical protein T492DRAFT_1113498 [Pavlovales sp. CCMP2436]|nr:hypothetical protein T492DRAFT_1113498 [Pavlovales sp. CCMP2436]